MQSKKHHKQLIDKKFSTRGQQISAKHKLKAPHAANQPNILISKKIFPKNKKFNATPHISKQNKIGFWQSVIRVEEDMIGMILFIIIFIAFFALIAWTFYMIQ